MTSNGGADLTLDIQKVTMSTGADKGTDGEIS